MTIRVTSLLGWNIQVYINTTPPGKDVPANPLKGLTVKSTTKEQNIKISDSVCLAQHVMGKNPRQRPSNKNKCRLFGSFFSLKKRSMAAHLRSAKTSLPVKLSTIVEEGCAGRKCE